MFGPIFKPRGVDIWDNSFIDIMVGLKDQLLADASLFAWIAAFFASVGGIIVTVRTCSGIMNGREFNLWELLKPIVIIIVCRNFVIVPRVLDIIPNTVTVITTDIIKSKTPDNKTFLVNLFQKLAEEENKETGKNMKGIDPNGVYTAEGVGGAVMSPSFGSDDLSAAAASSNDASLSGSRVFEDSSKNEKRFFDSLGKFLTSFFGALAQSFIAQLAQGFTALMDFVFPCVIGVSQVMLAILALLGPFSLSFTAFPGLSGFRSWVVKYLHLSLWMPIAYILYFVYNEGISLLSKVRFDIGDVLTSGGGIVTAILLFNIVVLINIFRIPTMANNIVEASVNSGLGGTPGYLMNKAKWLLNRTGVGRTINAARTITSGPKP